jgi:hypothetical protein
MLRFQTSLIEPDLRFSRIRLSEKVHAFACGIEDALAWARSAARNF